MSGRISRNDFEHLENTDIKLNVLFDTIVCYHETHGSDIEKLKKRRRIDTTWAMITGAVAGFFGALIRGFIAKP